MMRNETLDESIAEPMQTLDLLCFSSQVRQRKRWTAGGKTLFGRGSMGKLLVPFSAKNVHDAICRVTTAKLKRCIV